MAYQWERALENTPYSSATLDIYTDVTKDTKKKEAAAIGSYFENLQKFKKCGKSRNRG